MVQIYQSDFNITSLLNQFNSYIASGGDPSQLVYVFDVHGVLTSCADPSTPDGTDYCRPNVVSLVKTLQARGATIILSSAWNEAEEIRKCITAAGLQDFLNETPSLQNEVFDGEEFQVLRLGTHVISAGQKTVYFKYKAPAALIALRDRLHLIAQCYFVDDNPHNLELFKNYMERHLHLLPHVTEIGLYLESRLTKIKLRFSVHTLNDMRPYLPEHFRLYLNGQLIVCLPGALFEKSDRIALNEEVYIYGNEKDCIEVHAQCLESTPFRIALFQESESLEAVRLQMSYDATTGVKVCCYGVKYRP